MVVQKFFTSFQICNVFLKLEFESLNRCKMFATFTLLTLKKCFNLEHLLSRCTKMWNAQKFLSHHKSFALTKSRPPEIPRCSQFLDRSSLFHILNSIVFEWFKSIMQVFDKHYGEFPDTVWRVLRTFFVTCNGKRFWTQHHIFVLWSWLKIRKLRKYKLYLTVTLLTII